MGALTGMMGGAGAGAGAAGAAGAGAAGATAAGAGAAGAAGGSSLLSGLGNAMVAGGTGNFGVGDTGVNLSAGNQEYQPSPLSRRNQTEEQKKQALMAGLKTLSR